MTGKLMPELQDAIRALCVLSEACELRGALHLDGDARSALVLLIDGADMDGIVVDAPALGIMVGRVDG